MKILIIDDHSLFREGLCYVLDSLDEQVDIIEASNYERALDCLSNNPDLDLVLLDLNMPGIDGFKTLESCTEHYPATPVVILSASTQNSDVQRALHLGAVGYIPKDTSSEIMLNALRLVLSGGIYIPTEISQQNNDSSISTLTPRQKDVLALLVEGESNKVIAAKLALAEATVKMHVTAILKSLGVTNRTQAAIVAKKQIF